MNEHIAKTGFYLDLDSLLDTRLTVMLDQASSDEQKMQTITKWPDREVDSTHFCTYADFVNAFNKRDKLTLKRSTATNASLMISEFVKETISASITNPEKSKPVIYVNTYPYVLNENEIKVFLSVIKTITANMSDICFISKPTLALTPAWLKSNVAIALYYNPIEWLEAHSKNGTLVARACPDVTMYSPKLYHRERLQLEDGTDVFAQSLLYIKPFINLNFVNPNVFSCKIGLKKQ